MFDADSNLILVGEAASEERVKRLLTKERFRYISFATHGALANELQQSNEPALILSATEKEDGILKMSEISTLNLDSEWVILSACNTGAGDGSQGADGLSGLAKAFFYVRSQGALCLPLGSGFEGWPVSHREYVAGLSPIPRHIQTGSPQNSGSGADR